MLVVWQSQVVCGQGLSDNATEPRFLHDYPSAINQANNSETSLQLGCWGIDVVPVESAGDAGVSKREWPPGSIHGQFDTVPAQVPRVAWGRLLGSAACRAPMLRRPILSR